MNIELLVALAAIVISAIVPAITNQQNNESKEKIETLYMFCVHSLSLNLEFAIEDFEYPI